MGIKDQESGEAVRRKVMGNIHVDSSLENADEFDMPLQLAAMEHAWGGVWARDGLELKDRSMITIVILISQHAHHELRGHIIGALNNGLKVHELREIIIHCAAYCGYPAALSAMRVAKETVKNYR